MAAHLLAETSRLAFADRDPIWRITIFVAVPRQGLLSRRYSDERSRPSTRPRHGQAQPASPNR